MGLDPFAIQQAQERLAVIHARSRLLKASEQPEGDKDAPQGQPCSKESDLHEDIGRYCREGGLLAFHGSMAHRTFRTLGEPDWIILMPDGRLFMAECKAKGGKLSDAQQGVIRWAEKLGHTIHIVWNFEQFKELIEKEP